MKFYTKCPSCDATVETPLRLCHCCESRVCGDCGSDVDSSMLSPSGGFVCFECQDSFENADPRSMGWVSDRGLP